MAATSDKNVRCVFKVIRQVSLWLAMGRCWLWLESFNFYPQISEHTFALDCQVLIFQDDIGK